MKYYKLFLFCIFSFVINCKSANTISNTQIIESTENAVIIDVNAKREIYQMIVDLAVIRKCHTNHKDKWQDCKHQYAKYWKSQ